jgi:hypothetical protein
VNKLEKVKGSRIIMRILDGFIAAAVPHNIIDGFKNASISLTLDDDRVV